LLPLTVFALVMFLLPTINPLKTYAAIDPIPANPPEVTYLEEFFDCSPSINWCYAFSTLKDSDGYYKTWFFAPATKKYYSHALECIYIARNTQINKNWGVYTGSSWETNYQHDGMGAPKNWKPVICHEKQGQQYGHLTGDPIVIKYQDVYYMLYSMRDDTNDAGWVYSATSSDGINWDGKTVMWEGHRPALIIDGDILRVYYDIVTYFSNGTHSVDYYTRYLDLSNISDFRNPSSWSNRAEVAVTGGGGGSNWDFIKPKDKLLGVRDGMDSQGSLAISYLETEDGINMFQNGFWITKNDLPSPHNSDSDIKGAHVAQFFQDGSEYYLIANTITKGTLLQHAFIYHLSDPPPSPTCTGMSYSVSCAPEGGSYKVYAEGVSEKAVYTKFPTWDEEGGQNDIVWYDGVNEGDGRWSTTINQVDHSGSKIKTHIYMYDSASEATFCTGSDIPKCDLNPQLPAGTGTGLRGEYYNNMDFTSLVLTRDDTTINFNWGEGSPDATVGADTFSVRWEGQVEPRVEGSETYTFYTTSDDGVRLWVNDQLLIDNWTDHGPTEDTGTITLTGGQKYDIVLEFYENAVGSVIKLEWSSPSQTEEIIPQTQLYPSPSLLGDINGDEVVDIQDFIILSNAFGTNNQNADLNDDTIVDIQDFIILSNSFGNTR